MICNHKAILMVLVPTVKYVYIRVFVVRTDRMVQNNLFIILYLYVLPLSFS